MEGKELKQIITVIVREYVDEYPRENKISHLWREPLVGFADVNHPYICNLPYVVSETHRMPEDFMPAPTVIISYFIPFKKELADTNINVPEHAASKEWAEAYGITNTMMGRLNECLAGRLNEMGYRAAVPQNIGMMVSELKSPWSQRHIAYAAGLGTFGINNMLITKEGCCGRYNSIVADIPVDADQPLEKENCLYKSRGICKKCVANCFSGALTTEGFDRHKCYEACEKNMKVYGVDVCGKCDTNIPCAFTAP